MPLVDYSSVQTLASNPTQAYSPELIPELLQSARRPALSLSSTILLERQTVIHGDIMDRRLRISPIASTVDLDAFSGALLPPGELLVDPIAKDNQCHMCF